MHFPNQSDKRFVEAGIRRALAHAKQHGLAPGTIVGRLDDRFGPACKFLRYQGDSEAVLLTPRPGGSRDEKDGIEIVVVRNQVFDVNLVADRALEGKIDELMHPERNN